HLEVARIEVEIRFADLEARRDVLLDVVQVVDAGAARVARSPARGAGQIVDEPDARRQVEREVKSELPLRKLAWVRGLDALGVEKFELALDLRRGRRWNEGDAQRVEVDRGGTRCREHRRRRETREEGSHRSASRI